MTAQQYNIGPDAIGHPGTPGGPGFTLARREWIALQTFSTDALALPVTDDAFRKSLGPGASADLLDFTALVEAYAIISAHVTAWTTQTYPDTVALAGDVYQYGISKAPVYYPPLLVEARILEENPDDHDAKTALKSMLDHLGADTAARSVKAGAVATQIAQFAADAEADLISLAGAEGTGGLVAYYTARCGPTSAAVAQLAHDIADQRAVLQAANEAYDRDVVVASTTPAYAWIYPAGLVAAAVVAGLYGTRAVEALAASRAAQSRIDALDDPLAADANLLVALHSAELSLGAIVRDVEEVLPVVQRVQGVWAGIAADLDAISSLVDTDVHRVPPIIMGLGIDEAVQSWNAVALAADAFRVNAHVSEPVGALSMAAWQVDTQFASTRVAA